MAPRCLLLVLLCYFSSFSPTEAFIAGLYCGTENCYEILGMTRESTRSEITKAYRKLARKWHPDMHKGQEAKDEAEKMFQTIANAYEILRDEEQRKDYDYMLDNPDEYYRHYYYYYRHRMAPKVDVRIVIVVTITVISACQYYGQWSNYNEAIKYLLQQPKYRMRATDIAKKEGLLGGVKDKKKNRGKSKDEIREEEEEILKKILLEKMDIKGGYSKPDIYRVLWLWMVFSPYYLGEYVYWYARWIYKYNIRREEYEDVDKLYIIRKYMKSSASEWDAIEDYQKEDFLDRELWIKQNFTEWKRIQDEDMKATLAESAKYKSYRRWLKNNGPGQMTFGPE